MHVIELLGATMGLAFVSGINLYATVLSLGLGIQFGLIQLSPELAGLQVLGHPVVLVIAAVAYTAEFFADKIPWVDSLWDSVHTFVRPLGAAIIGAAAIGDVDPGLELGVFLLCGGVALTTHLTKAGTRLIVNQSPEPFSNIGVSLGEDVIAVGGTWLSIYHPYIALGVVLAFLAGFAWLAPKVFRLLRVELLAVVAKLRSRGAPQTVPAGASLFDHPPWSYHGLVSGGLSPKSADFCVRSVSGRGFDFGRNRVGYFCFSGDALFFLTRKRFRPFRADIDVAELEDVTADGGFLFDRLILYGADRNRVLHLFKDRGNRAESLAGMLQSARDRIAGNRIAAKEAGAR
jgi:hypothetical protein